MKRFILAFLLLAPSLALAETREAVVMFGLPGCLRAEVWPGPHTLDGVTVTLTDLDDAPAIDAEVADLYLAPLLAPGITSMQPVVWVEICTEALFGVYRVRVEWEEAVDSPEVDPPQPSQEPTAPVDAGPVDADRTDAGRTEAAAPARDQGLVEAPQAIAPWRSLRSWRLIWPR